MATVWTDSAAAAFLPLLPDGHVLPELDLERLEATVLGPSARLLLAEEGGDVARLYGLRLEPRRRRAGRTWGR